MKIISVILVSLMAFVACSPAPSHNEEIADKKIIVDTSQFEKKLAELQFGNYLEVEVLGSNRYMTRFVAEDEMRLTITGFAFAKYVQDAVNENPNFITIAYVYDFKDQKLMAPIEKELRRLDLSQHVKFFPEYDVKSRTKRRIFSVRLDGTNEYFIRTDFDDPLPSKLTGREFEQFLTTFYDKNPSTKVFIHVQNPENKEYMQFFRNIVNKSSLKSMDAVILTLVE